MDEVFLKIQEMLGHAFDQGMAYQRVLIAQDEFDNSSAFVAKNWAELRETLVPPETEEGTPDTKKVN